MRTFKTFILAIVLGMLTQVASAVPAQKGVKKQIRLTDGTVVTATLQGDEQMSYYVLADGRPAVREADGRFRIETPDGVEALRRNAIRREAAQHGGKTLARRRADRLPRRNAARAAAMEGRKKGLVLLVNFTDNRFAAANTPAFYHRYFNEEGFSDGGMTGSVHDYFFDQSYGRLSIDFDVVGPIALSHNMAYYGGPTATDHDNMPHVLEMVVEACQKADAQVNFADYDWDGDGEVDQVYLVYAGYGQASGGGDNTIWPHEYGLWNSAIQLDGVWVNTYACSNELNIDNSTTGIGTACHEFSHCLGLSDHYDTGGSGNPTPAEWDLMASGSYNNNQCTPVGYTAFERWQSGWLTPVELTEAATVTGMKPIDLAPEAYMLTNDYNPDEYYILENRRLSKWNRYPGGHGLLIMHVDYDPTVFEYNEVNVDADHLRMQVVAADGRTGKPFESDTWPGTAGKTRLTDESNPRASVFTGDRDGNLTLGKPLTAIREATDGTVSFTVMEGVMPKPVMQPFTDVVAGGFTANWTPVDGATAYTVALRQVPAAPATPAEAVMVYEDFSNCIADKVPINTIRNFDDLLNLPGFTGTACYKNPKGLQLGKAKTMGTLKTPDLDEPLSGRISILFGIRPTGTDTEAGVQLGVNTGGRTFGKSYSGNGTFYIRTLEGLMASGPFSVELSSTKNPIVLDLLIVLDGVFDDDELNAWLLALDAPAEVQWTCVSMPAPARRSAPARVKGTTTEYTTSQPFYTFSGLDAKDNYYVSVKAHCATGDSRWSAERRVDTPTAVLSPFAPAGVGGRAFDLSGRPADSRFRGITVKDGRLIMQ